MIKKILFPVLLMVSMVQAEIGLEYYVGAQDHFMWRGFDLSSGEPFLTPGLTASIGESIWVDAWFGLNQDYQEMDLTAAYYLEPSEDFGIDLGLVAYTYPGMDGYDPSYEPFATIYSYSLPFEPQLLLAYDLTLETTYLEVSGTKTIMEDGFALDLKAGTGLYAWEGFTGISTVYLEVAKEYEAMGLSISPTFQFHLIPQGFRDDVMDPSISGTEFVFQVNIAGGGE